VEVSPQLFAICVAVGAAVNALWLDVRYPGLAPVGLCKRFLLHLAAAAIALKIAVPAGMHYTAGLETTSGRLLAVFGFGFPGLVYAFLVALWSLKLVHASRGGGIR
jgi:hypothetical protein